jgi:hypothetical protein
MACGRVEFTGVEVAGGAEITDPMQKAVASPHCAGGARAVHGQVSSRSLQAVRGRDPPWPQRTGQAEREMCANGLLSGCREQ